MVVAFITSAQRRTPPPLPHPAGVTFEELHLVRRLRGPVGHRRAGRRRAERFFVGADEHLCTTYFDVHQGYRVLTHSHRRVGASFQGMLGLKLVASYNGFSIKPLKVKLLAGEQQATEVWPGARFFGARQVVVCMLL